MNDESQQFEQVYFNTAQSFAALTKKYTLPLDQESRTQRRLLFGKNLIDVRVKNVIELLFEEVCIILPVLLTVQDFESLLCVPIIFCNYLVFAKLLALCIHYSCGVCIFSLGMIMLFS